MHYEPMVQDQDSLAARAANDRARRLAKRLAGRPSRSADASAVEVVDEAFAGFSRAEGQVQRVDAATSATDAVSPATPVSGQRDADWARIKRTIATDLAGQLNALDHQRERLAKLLRTIADDSSAG